MTCSALTVRSSRISLGKPPTLRTFPYRLAKYLQLDLAGIHGGGAIGDNKGSLIDVRDFSTFASARRRALPLLIDHRPSQGR